MNKISPDEAFFNSLKALLILFWKTLFMSSKILILKFLKFQQFIYTIIKILLKDVIWRKGFWSSLHFLRMYFLCMYVYKYILYIYNKTMTFFRCSRWKALWPGRRRQPLCLMLVKLGRILEQVLLLLPEGLTYPKSHFYFEWSFPKLVFW